MEAVVKCQSNWQFRLLHTKIGDIKKCRDNIRLRISMEKTRFGCHNGGVWTPIGEWYRKPFFQPTIAIGFSLSKKTKIAQTVFSELPRWVRFTFVLYSLKFFSFCSFQISRKKPSNSEWVKNMTVLKSLIFYSKIATNLEINEKYGVILDNLSQSESRLPLSANHVSRQFSSRKF